MKNLKFKKLTKSCELKIEGGYATNRVYIVNKNWLDSVPCRGNMQLRRRVTKAVIDTVSARLEGREVKTLPILNLLNSINLAEFSPVNFSEATRPVEGYYKGRASEFDLVAFGIGGETGPTLDAEFYPALLWDSGATVYIKDNTSPVVVVKNKEIVFVVMPLKPKTKNE